LEVAVKAPTAHHALVVTIAVRMIGYLSVEEVTPVVEALVAVLLQKPQILDDGDKIPFRGRGVCFVSTKWSRVLNARIYRVVY
jgi:hypothetical protein